MLPAPAFPPRQVRPGVPLRRAGARAKWAARRAVRRARLLRSTASARLLRREARAAHRESGSAMLTVMRWSRVRVELVEMLRTAEEARASVEGLTIASGVHLRLTWSAPCKHSTLIHRRAGPHSVMLPWCVCWWELTREWLRILLPLAGAGVEARKGRRPTRRRERAKEDHFRFGLASHRLCSPPQTTACRRTLQGNASIGDSLGATLDSPAEGAVRLTPQQASSESAKDLHQAAAPAAEAVDAAQRELFTPFGAPADKPMQVH